MARKTKRIAIALVVRVPSWMTAAQARREVRSLINDQCFFLDRGPDWQEFGEGDLRAVVVAKPRRESN